MLHFRRARARSVNERPDLLCPLEMAASASKHLVREILDYDRGERCANEKHMLNWRTRASSCSGLRAPQSAQVSRAKSAAQDVSR